jgi:hypothetical protein
MKKKHNQAYFKALDINDLNKDLPLKLKSLEQINNAVAQKYPLLKKTEISLISKALMEEIRAQLLEGNSINVRNFLIGMKLYTFAKLRKNKIVFSTKIQVSSPPQIKKQNVRD